MRFYTQAAPILLRHRSPRPIDVRLHPRPGGRGRRCTGTCPPSPSRSSRPSQPYREDIVVAVECMFTWYWLADLCAREEHPLRPRSRPLHEGHPRRQGQERPDRLPARSPGCCAAACSPRPTSTRPEMRSTRDLLRRRNYLIRKRAELLAHIQNTNSQYNLPEFGQKIAYKVAPGRCRRAVRRSRRPQEHRGRPRARSTISTG